MDKNRSSVTGRNVLCAVICILVVVVLGYLYYRNEQQENAQTAALQALQDEAEPYESELQALRTELSSLNDDVSYISEEASIIAGFVLSDVSDLSYIEEKAETYDISPVLVIDCTMDMESIEAIVETADADWEIMLYATDFSEEKNEDVLSVLSWLSSIEREHSGVFLLRSDYSSENNRKLLSEDGFIGYTSYNENPPLAGQAEDGSIYFDYSYLTVSGTSITSRLSSLYSSKSTMIVVFDMASINSGSMSEAYVVSLFDTIKNYADKEDCSFSTVTDAVLELSEVNAIEAENQAAYEEQVAEIQARIDELQEIIDNIYDKAE